MRRNNCWLAILAVTTVLPILRHGLARERFSVDHESAVLRVTSNEATYRTEGPILNDEADPVSRDDVTDFLVETTTSFPSDPKQSPDSSTRECAVPSDSTEAISRRGCARIEDLFDESYTVDTSLEASREETERVNGPSTKDSKRFDESRAVETRATLAKSTRTDADVSMSRRPARWIPRDAIKDSVRIVDAIHRDGRATTRARKRGTRSTNRRGIVVHPRPTYYDHVARIPTSNARGDTGRSISTKDREFVDVFGEIDGDVGSRARSRSEFRERNIPERVSSVDTIVNAAHGASTRERRITMSRTPVERSDNDGTNVFSSRGTRNDRDESVYDLIHGGRRSRDSLDTGEKNLDRSERSLDEPGTERRRSSVLENAERLSTSRISAQVITTNGERGSRVTSAKQVSTTNDDAAGDNSGPSATRREIRVAFSASSTVSVQQPPTERERWNLVPFRDALVSITPSKGYYPGKNADWGRAARNGTEFNFAGNNGVASDSSNVRGSRSRARNGENDRDDRNDDDRVERKRRDGDIERNGPSMEKSTTSRNVTSAAENAPADSAHDGTPATERNLAYPKRVANGPSEGGLDARSNDPRPRVRNARNPRGDTEEASTGTTLVVGNSSTNELSGGSAATAYGADIAPSRRDQERSRRVDGPTLSASYDRSISLTEPSRRPPLKRNDHGTENYDERGTVAGLDEELNDSPTNDPVIVFEDAVPRTTGRDSLSQNSRLSARVIEDNETAVGFPSGEPRSKGDQDAVATNEVNPTTKLRDEDTGGRSNQPRETKNSIDEPLEPKVSIDQPLKAKNSIDQPLELKYSINEPLKPKDSIDRPLEPKDSIDEPREPIEGTSTVKQGDSGTKMENSVTSWSVTSKDEDERVETSSIGSSRNDSISGIRGVSTTPDKVIETEDRSTVTNEIEETSVAEVTPFGDVPYGPTEYGRTDVETSIVPSSTDLVYPGIDEETLATVADASRNSTDNASDGPPWPVKHSAVVEGDLVLGGLMMVHEREDTITCGPVMPQGGVQALEVMLYTLDWVNEQNIVPGVKIGAHILDDCDKDTYGLEMAVDFIKGSISNIDGAEYHCNKTAVRKVISGVVGAASSVTSIQVANLLRLFRIPQVSFFSTSPELSNKNRFEYFSRTIPSDHYQVKAMVDIVLTMGWRYVSIIYEESNYGIKAFEELEELLGKYDICIAIKEKLVKDSGVAEETAYDNIVLKLLTKPRARGCIIYGSDQEVAGVMRAVRRCNATGAFSWIGSDGWSARGLVSNGNEPEVEGTLSVQPQANPIKGFKEYFLNLTVENNRRNPWFVEFWEHHFQCRYPNSSKTPYNKGYTKLCTTKERLTAQNTAFEDQLQFVSDAVMAFAYAFRNIHKDFCLEQPGLCDHMKPTKGTELLKYLREVEFEGLSGDKFKFDKNGDGPARYNIIHFKQTEPGKYKWVRVGKYLEGELRLNMSEIQFKLGHRQPPESVCSLPCEVGQAKKYVEGERCCWHCFNCTQYQIRHPKDETQCIPCRQGTVPDETHSTCRDIPEEFLRPESGWAIGAMSFSATGMLITLFVCGVFLKHNDTPVVRASGRELSYVLLSGILLCYLVTFALVMRPTDIVCGIQRFAAGFCFTVVYAALLTKTNRISRIFNASKHSAKRPSFISPRSQLIICSGLVFVQILINGVWMIIDPAKAMHHYPTREDNLLVCNSYVDASYMIAFAYPIMLIVVCTVYAVLTRKIPEAFNESKHIGFTMYTTCVIWLAFVPLYFGTGNNVALRITSMSVTISLSASVTIACLFSPKLYIILIRPERNIRQSMMPTRYNTTKSSAVTATNASSMIAPVTLTAATCDQNKTVKKHIISTIDCSTQSEYYELEVKDQKNGKPPPTFVSRSTQTSNNNDKDSTAIVTGKDSKENTATTTKENTTTTKQLNNNARIGNGPVNQTDVSL